MTQDFRVSEKGGSTKIAYPKSLRLEMEVENIRNKFGKELTEKDIFQFLLLITADWEFQMHLM